MPKCSDCVAGCPNECALAGHPWHAGSSEGALWFQEEHCARCTKDAAANGTIELYDALGHELCPIIAKASFDPVPEWTRRPDGVLICTEFQPKDEPGLPRCPHTLELPL